MAFASLLLISDDDSLADALQSALPRAARIERLRSGSDVAGQMMAAPSDLVLVDDPLPDADGLEVLRLVARSWRDARICFVTGRHDADRERTVRQLGAFYYTSRPLELVDLSRVLTRALAAGD
ncbi:MAG: response regulator [Candidatus Wallbacteria bacterium]|nr:response regulator [Candidatus Wallbacteria bacterium]